jgi:hypothetical protein
LNRKKAERYRFHGLWGIEPIRIDRLAGWVADFREKLADPGDGDDKRWVGRWLARFEQELVKKERGFEQKRISNPRDHRHYDL